MLRLKMQTVLTTYISILVRNVVGQLEFVETDHLLHPLLPCTRRVWMDVAPAGHLRVCLTGHRPLAVVELVPTVVHRHDVQDEEVLGLLVQPR